MSWHIRISITLDRNEIWAWDLYHFTALVKSVAYILDVKKHGKVPYQKPKVYGTWHYIHIIIIVQYHSAMRSVNST